MQFIKTYFECFREAGINTVFRIYRMNGADKVGEMEFDHVDYDGVSAVTTLARQFPADGFMAPKLTVKPKPSIFKCFLELVKWYVRFYPFMPPKWKEYSKTKKNITSAIIEVENWQKNDSKISVNTKLLFALDLASKEFLTNDKKPRVWMAPVGMYNGITRDIEPSNKVSFIDIKIKDGMTEFDIQSVAKKHLMELSYWGTIGVMWYSTLLGKAPFVFATKHIHHVFRRTGTFSNLGEWKIPSLPQDEWWTFGQGCVAKMSPVEGTAMVINNRMGLSLHIHESIGMPQDEADRFIKRWREIYLGL
jgi:hypothetical protein